MPRVSALTVRRARSTPLLALAIIVLAACSTHDPADESDSTVDIVRSNRGGSDYLVSFFNRSTFFFNGDSEADRANVTRARLKLLGCRNPVKLSEQAEEQEGTWRLGHPKIVYYSEWKCSS